MERYALAGAGLLAALGLIQLGHMLITLGTVAAVGAVVAGVFIHLKQEPR